MLPKLGLNYKRGLMELSMNSELVEYSINPLGVCSLPKFKNSSVRETINANYAKCAFRIKILKSTTLAPLEELGPSNIDRIKGFSADMFLLAQKQRISLCKSVKSSFDMETIIRKIEYMIKENENSTQEFAKSKNECQIIKQFVHKGIPLFEQFVTLLDLTPQNVKKINTVMLQFPNNPPENDVKVKCIQILEKLKNLKMILDEIDIDFPSNGDTKALNNHKNKVLSDINKLVTEYSTLSLLSALKKFMNEHQNQEIIETRGEVIDSIDDKLDDLVHTILLSLQKLYKQYDTESVEKLDNDINNVENLLSEKMYLNFVKDWSTLNVDFVLSKLNNIFKLISNSGGVKFKCIIAFAKILPTLKQYYSLVSFFLQQKIASHHATVETLNIVLGAFLTLTTKGFCIPPDLKENENEIEENAQRGEGFGLDDGTGEKDASDKLESEDQLDSAKKPDDKQSDEQEEKCKEEKGIEMSENFDATQENMEKPENEEDDSGESDNDSELDKEMGETENDAEQLDDQIWGGDDENEINEEEKDMKEDEGKGSKDDNDVHNGLDQENPNNETDENNKLDATSTPQDSEKQNKSKNDNDNIDDQENNEEQSNSMHNELEEPPEPEEMELGDIDMTNDDENQKDKDDDDDDDGRNPFDIGESLDILVKMK